MLKWPGCGLAPRRTRPHGRSFRRARWRTTSTSSPRSRSPRVTPTRSPIRSRMPFWTRSSPRIRGGRVACETLLTTGLVVVAGEITTSSHVDISDIARQTVRDVGYTRAKYGFDCDDLRRDRLRPQAVAEHRQGSRPGHRQAGRGRPGPHVRLRVQRDAGADARCPSRWPMASCAASPRSVGRARCRTSGPTASRQVTSSTTTASRCGSRPSSSRPSTQPNVRLRAPARGDHRACRRSGPASSTWWIAGT